MCVVQYSSICVFDLCFLAFILDQPCKSVCLFSWKCIILSFITFMVLHYFFLCLIHFNATLEAVVYDAQIGGSVFHEGI